jgi:hypothetical protein
MSLLKSAHVIPRIVECAAGCWIWWKASYFGTMLGARYSMESFGKADQNLRLNKASPGNSIQHGQNTLQKNIWKRKITPPPHEGHSVSSRKLAVTVAKHCEYHAMSSEPGKRTCAFSEGSQLTP